MVLMVLVQQFWINVLGMTSSAWGDCTIGTQVNIGDGLGFLIQGLNKTQTLIKMHIWAISSQIQFPEKYLFPSTSSGSPNIIYKSICKLAPAKTRFVALCGNPCDTTSHIITVSYAHFVVLGFLY